MKLHHLIVVLGIATLFISCKARTSPVNAISASDAQQLGATGESDARQVGFGGKFILLGAVSHTTGDGLLIELAWKAHGRQKLEYLVPVHALDADGKIVGQSDYRQDEKRREVEDGTIWRDEVRIPRESLAGATNIGIGLLGDGKQWLPPDRGPRDQDQLRLLLPVPSEVSNPPEPSPFDGFLEAVNNSEIVGWAWQKGEADKVIEVEIYDGENMLGKVNADIVRADLEKAGIGDGRHGFRMEMPSQLKDGQPHRIAARVAATDFELHKSPKSFEWKK